MVALLAPVPEYSEKRVICADNRRSADNSVVVRVGEQLDDGWVYHISLEITIVIVLIRVIQGKNSQVAGA
jgi:hypothetical protein